MSVTPETARSTAREAYTYGFPMVESYKTQYKQAIATSESNFKAPLNQIGRAVGVVTLDDTFVVTPNTDTPYCDLWADLPKQSLSP